MATPLHPLVVHFPIALLLTGGVIGILAVLLRRPGLHPVALWFMIPGWLGAAVASATGDDLGEQLRGIPGMRAAVHLHERWAYITMVLFALAIIWLLAQVRFAPKLASRTAVVYVLVVVLGLGALVLTGKYGGDMVWGKGAPAEGQIVPLTGEHEQGAPPRGLKRRGNSGGQTSTPTTSMPATQTSPLE